MLRVLFIDRLNVALLIAQSCEDVKDALAGTAPSRNNTLHGEPGAVRLCVLPLQPGHIAVLTVDGEHDLRRAGDVGLVPDPEDRRLQIIELPPDDPEEDSELVDCPASFFQRSKQKVEHIVAEGVKPFHPVTPF